MTHVQDRHIQRYNLSLKGISEQRVVYMRIVDSFSNAVL